MPPVESGREALLAGSSGGSSRIGGQAEAKLKGVVWR
jgi:hypothetical protein